MEGIESLAVIRAGSLAKLLDLKRDTVRRQLKAGMYGPRLFLHGEWCVRRADLERWLANGQVDGAAAPLSMTRHLKRGTRPALSEVVA